MSGRSTSGRRTNPAPDSLVAEVTNIRNGNVEKAVFLADFLADPVHVLGCYLRLIDWTGRQIRKDKVGQIPADCAPILDRLQCDAETWLDFAKNFRQRFRNEAGLAPSRQSYRQLLRSRRQSPVAT